MSVNPILSLLFGCLLLLYSGQVKSDTPEEIELRVRAALVFQFTKFFTWPESKGEFAINVIDDEAQAKALAVPFGSHQVAGRTVTVVTTTFAGSVLKPGQIAVFPKKDSSLLRPAIEKLKDVPCLTVSDASSSGSADSDITFVLVDGKIRFRLHPEFIKKKGLKIDPKFTSLALPPE